MNFWACHRLNFYKTLEMRNKFFKEKVLKLCATIPRGRVATYKLIADRLGNPRASRAVGRALNCNESLIKIPCHRVVRSDGKVGGYRGGIYTKMKLLRIEGVRVSKGGVVELNKYLYKF